MWGPLYTSLHQVTIEGLTRNVAFLEAESLRREKQETQAQATLDEKAGVIGKLEETIKELQARCLQCETKRGDDAKQALQEVHELTQRLRESDDAVNRRSRAEDVGQLYEESRQESARLRAELDALRMTLDRKEAEVRQTTELVDGSHQQVEDLQRQMAIKDAQIDTLTHTASELQKSVAEQQACISMWTQQQVDTARELAGSSKVHTEQLNRMQAQMDGKDSLIERLQAELKGVERNCADLRQENSALQENLRVAEVRAEELEEEVMMARDRMQLVELQATEGISIAGALEAKEMEAIQLSKQISELTATCAEQQAAAQEASASLAAMTQVTRASCATCTLAPHVPLIVTYELYVTRAGVPSASVVARASCPNASRDAGHVRHPRMGSACLRCRKCLSCHAYLLCLRSATRRIWTSCGSTPSCRRSRRSASSRRPSRRSYRPRWRSTSSGCAISWRTTAS